MHFSKILPLAALASLATAQGPDYWARFSTKAGEIFDVTAQGCVNFQKSQPIYNTLVVKIPFRCDVFEARDCVGRHEPFSNGAHEITELQFKSVNCYFT
ncbi:hypothetical protein VC83_03156 [Pseudogymnoascus destructans]|uniref:Uncharacterized protein n=2 Tax=Pseudogymnoascus destructans TaxID=655981 RepID=L8GBJ3_PSED2|nr:uncharacterized protein VC83_03156 [Pseudogymnoascus destructans]ELR09411.1 hypothetical protein GMDG_03975 [Pseudogymnoascus destructans 20631-21]OAF59998.1 hypothetical protein VC83_03156 [Pseudogymnoascus destructans]